MNLSSDRKKKIRSTIEENGLYWMATSVIGEKFKFKFYEVDFQNLFIDSVDEKKYLNSRWIILGNGEEYVIIVDSNLPEPEKKFIAAHEIWHFFLHKDFIDKHSVYYEPDGLFDGVWIHSDWMEKPEDDEVATMEIEANEFASELLIPSKTMHSIYRFFSDAPDQIASLSKVFEMPEGILSRRLVDLWIK